MRATLCWLQWRRVAHRRGQVILGTVNDATIVPFVSDQLNNVELALTLAKKGNLPGAEALIGKQFELLYSSGKYKEAAEAAAESPQVSFWERSAGAAGRDADAAPTSPQPVRRKQHGSRGVGTAGACV